MTIYAEKLNAVRVWRDDEPAPRIIEDVDSWEFFEWVEAAMEAEILARPTVLDTLPENERHALQVRYGIIPWPKRSYKAIGEMLGVKPSKAQAIVAKGLQRLTGDEFRRLKKAVGMRREHIAEWMGDVEPPDNPLMTPF
jgi:DNA-directed RNA polymerase specialized sigma subunit